MRDVRRIQLGKGLMQSILILLLLDKRQHVEAFTETIIIITCQWL